MRLLSLAVLLTSSLSLLVHADEADLASCYTEEYYLTDWHFYDPPSEICTALFSYTRDQVIYRQAMKPDSIQSDYHQFVSAGISLSDYIELIATSNGYALINDLPSDYAAMQLDRVSPSASLEQTLSSVKEVFGVDIKVWGETSGRVIWIGEYE